VAFLAACISRAFNIAFLDNKSFLTPEVKPLTERKCHAAIVDDCRADSHVDGANDGQMRSKEMKKKNDMKQELIRLEREFGQAQPRRDLAALDRLMADEFVATVPPGILITKAQVIAQVASPHVDIESLINDEIEVRIFGDAAVVTARGTAKGRMQGKDASGQFRYTRVWIKRAGRWQAVAAHSTLIGH
jgi:ketosteroid isomerase-like protein